MNGPMNGPVNGPVKGPVKGGQVMEPAAVGARAATGPGRPGTGQRIAAAALLSIGAVFVVAFALPVVRQPDLRDDTFITLTYAKNLAEGRGFVFNHGPATLGTTSPLLAFVAAAGARAVPGWDALDAALWAGIGSLIAAGWLIFLLLARAGFAPLPAAAGALSSMLSVLTWRASLGMEMPLFFALLAACLLLYLDRRLLAAGLGVGLLALLRGEGALLGLIFLGHRWIATRRFPGRLFLGGAAIGLAWLAYSLPTFGTFLPNTVSAGRMLAEMAGQGSAFGVIFSKLWRMVLEPYAPQGLPALHMPLLAGALGLGALWRRRLELPLILIAWLAAFVIGYSLIGVRVMNWYVSQIAFGLEILTAAGVATVLAWMSRAREGRARTLAVGCGSVFVIALCASLLAGMREAAPRPAIGARNQYRELAQWLREHAEPHQSVAFYDVGYLGYYTPNPIVDLAGLTQPAVLRILRERGPSAVLEELEPDFLVVLEGLVHLPMLEPAMSTHYFLAHRVEHARGRPDMLVHARTPR